MMGLTPIDTGYNYAGLVIAGAVMQYLRPVMVSVVIGSLIWMVYHSLLSNSLKPLIVYFISMFAVVSFFLPTTSPPNPVSAGESKAIISSRQVATNIIGNRTGNTSLGLVWIDRFLTSMTITTARLIESGGAVREQGRVVGGVPFEYARAYMEVMGNRIQDPQLREEFLDFISTSYIDSLQKWQNQGRPNLPVGKTILYPGDIVSLYGTPEDMNKWRILEDRIYREFLGRNSRLSFPFQRKFFIIRTIKNELSDRDTVNALTTRILGNTTYFSGGSSPLSILAGWGEKVFTTALAHIISVFGYLLTALIIPALPVLQGMLNFLVLVAFPFVLLFSFFPNNFKILPKYFLTLLWTKSLTIAWAVVNCFQNLGWVFASSQGQNTFSWIIGGVPIFGTLAGILIMPFLFFKIIAEGLAYAQEFITGRALESGQRVVGRLSEKGLQQT